MQCPNCGHESVPQEARCLRCGERLTMSRPQGGWLVPIGEVLSCPVAVHKSCFLLPLGAVLMQLALARHMWDGLLEVLVALAIWASIVRGPRVRAFVVDQDPAAALPPGTHLSRSVRLHSQLGRSWLDFSTRGRRFDGTVASLAFSVLCLAAGDVPGREPGRWRSARFMLWSGS
jgi:hypothetical protein